MGHHPSFQIFTSAHRHRNYVLIQTPLSLPPACEFRINWSLLSTFVLRVHLFLVAFFACAVTIAASHPIFNTVHSTNHQNIQLHRNSPQTTQRAKMIAKPLLILASLALGTAAQTLYPGDASWTYKGCFNETSQLNSSSGLRALNNGPTTTNDQMNVPVCLTSCKGYKYAGVEYTKLVTLKFYTSTDYWRLGRRRGAIEWWFPG